MWRRDRPGALDTARPDLVDPTQLGLSSHPELGAATTQVGASGDTQRVRADHLSTWGVVIVSSP